MGETGERSSTIDGEKRYQQIARKALPLLVRQAGAAHNITYNELAQELGMRPRNLNYVLGAIGNTLSELGRRWGNIIPPIQCVVVSKKTGLPGEGVGWFLNMPEDFKTLSRARKREIIEGKLQDIYGYSRWHVVLKELGLQYVAPDYFEANRNATQFGGGESADHKALKAFVANTPVLFGLPISSPVGLQEHALPSGDTLDVSFRHRENWVAAEVKSARSPEADIIRGIYQCVKYLAVMRAVQTSEDQDRSARVVLVLGGAFPSWLLPLKNQLGVEAIENVQVMPSYCTDVVP